MTKFRFLALFAALALLLTVSTTVLAQAPKQPNVFTGEVMVGDEMAMEGTMVTAMIDGETVGMAEVMDGMYSIKLDPGDPSAEGYMDFTGKTVMFMVGMEEVEQSEMWMEGMISSPFNLMAMAMEPEPTMEPVMMPGPRGRDGQPGLPGADGADGADGQDGRQGSQGPKGSTGDDGADGADGNDGAAGRNGADGNDGADGSDGASGAKGDTGDMGAPGSDGTAGAGGAAGADGGGGALAIIGLIIAIVALVAAGESTQWAGAANHRPGSTQAPEGRPQSGVPFSLYTQGTDPCSNVPTSGACNCSWVGSGSPQVALRLFAGLLKARGIIPPPNCWAGQSRLNRGGL